MSCCAELQYAHSISHQLPCITINQAPQHCWHVLFLQAKALGSTNKMMGGGCEPFCVWNSDLTTDDIEFAIELDDFPAWVEDVKRIFTYDLKENGAAHDR